MAAQNRGNFTFIHNGRKCNLRDSFLVNEHIDMMKTKLSQKSLLLKTCSVQVTNHSL